ncbi:unnamed protein product [Arctia plantaginis]|uniref:Uncharacterized protein n=1 Tax=Arctia plantaginis TaxID=874455 RepID=A0A8S0ZQ31_ARCPL|nr:unnamed protein product [Arctia plantaginis]
MGKSKNPTKRKSSGHHHKDKSGSRTRAVNLEGVAENPLKLLKLLHYNRLMLNQHFDAREHARRRRRGLINGIGYVANSLFGVLDERFAEQYKSDIQLVKRKEQHLANLIKNHHAKIYGWN